jgi:DNA-binding response OmpR family regulator
LDEYISKPLETAELHFVLNKYLKGKATEKPTAEAKEEIKITGTEPMGQADADNTVTLKEISPEPISEASAPHTDDTIILADDTEEKKILIAKKGLLESRILAKMIQNLNYEFDTLGDLSKIEEMSLSGKYDILIADSDLLPANLNEIQDKVAIITFSDPDANQEALDITRGESISQAVSREILETLINKYRG